jgi:hypothetical protein
MNLRFVSLLAGLLFCGPAALRAEPAADSLAEAGPVLQSGYVDYAGLQVRPDDRLADLLTRAQGKIFLGPASPVAPPPVQVVRLPDGIPYCRLASFNGWTALAAQLKTGGSGVILDLRSNTAPDDFAGAAGVAGLFTPSGTLLFAVRDARQNCRSYSSPLHGTPISGGPMAVLIDGRTSGAAEALAACLKANGALIIGRPTAGNGAEFEDHRLASGEVLRYLAGEVTMADGNDLWHHAVEPDIGVSFDPRKEEAALALIGQNRILDVIGEAAGSHRLSEASLVRGEDPEVEAYLVTQARSTAPPAPPAPPAPQDACLVAALDSLKAIRLSQGAPAAAKTLQ